MNKPEFSQILDDRTSAMFDHFSSLHAFEKRSREDGLRHAATRIADEKMALDHIAKVLDVPLLDVQVWLRDRR